MTALAAELWNVYVYRSLEDDLTIRKVSMVGRVVAKDASEAIALGKSIVDRRKFRTRVCGMEVRRASAGRLDRLLAVFKPKPQRALWRQFKRRKLARRKDDADYDVIEEHPEVAVTVSIDDFCGII